MSNLQRYRSADLSQLMDKIVKNSIGMDDYFDQFWNVREQTSNYPPYNLVQVNNVESRLEIALAGFTKDEEFVHKGLANRSFTRVWTITDDTEVRDVQFRDGLLVVQLGKIVPEHHTRKDYL
mgnify:CR=1 FL=1